MTDYPRKRGRPRKERKVVSLLFKFISIEQIMEWCCVCRATAYKYKYGGAQPSRRCIKLVKLHSEGRVLGPEWEGFLIRGNTLWNPENKPLTVGEVMAYSLVVQFAHELRHRNPELELSLQLLTNQSAR